MGTPASGTIEILCVDNESAIKVEKLLDGIDNKLFEYFKKKSNKNGYFNFYKLERLEDTLYLENDSDTIQNTEWQIDTLVSYLKENTSGLICEFSADTTVTENYTYDDFKGEQNNNQSKKHDK